MLLMGFLLIMLEWMNLFLLAMLILVALMLKALTLIMLVFTVTQKPIKE